jgi:hypothetical protein
MPNPFITEPMATYNARRGEKMTSHSLSKFMHSPALFRMSQDEPPGVRNQAFVFGEAAHIGILEGIGKVRDSIAVGGPINPKTNDCYGTKTKAFQTWLDDSTHDVAISASEFDMIQDMAVAVSAHTVASRLLEGDTVVEGTLMAEMCDVPCQSRLDVFNRETGTIIDLKTCADLDDFERDARKYNYIRQMAFYHTMARISGLQSPDCTLIAVEKKSPYRVGVWKIAHESIMVEVDGILDAIERYDLAKAIDQWPTGYEETRMIETKKGWA